MKRFFPLVIIIVLLVFGLACGDKVEAPKEPVQPKKEEKPKEPTPIEKFAKELQTNCKPGVELTFEQLEALAKQLHLVLPETTGDLADCEWDVSCSKNKDDKDMLFALELNRKKGEEKEQLMWFHVIYNPHLTQEERDGYSTETFQGYKATFSENAHLWVLVNNTEIRAVAEADEYKNDEKIKAVVGQFKLKDIETF